MFATAKKSRREKTKVRGSLGSRREEFNSMLNLWEGMEFRTGGKEREGTRGDLVSKEKILRNGRDRNRWNS